MSFWGSWDHRRAMAAGEGRFRYSVGSRPTRSLTAQCVGDETRDFCTSETSVQPGTVQFKVGQCRAVGSGAVWAVECVLCGERERERERESVFVCTVHCALCCGRGDARHCGRGLPCVEQADGPVVAVEGQPLRRRCDCGETKTSFWGATGRPGAGKGSTTKGGGSGVVNRCTPRQGRTYGVVRYWSYGRKSATRVCSRDKATQCAIDARAGSAGKGEGGGQRKSKRKRESSTDRAAS